MRKAKFKKGDTVRLLDGKDIPSYAGIWVSGMREYIGTETTIEHVQYDKYVNTFRYMVANNGYMWDERGMEAVESKPDWKVLIVPIDGNVTEGRLIENGKVVKTVTTKKSKEDEYNIEEACKVIVERLFEREKLETRNGYTLLPIGTVVKINDTCARDYNLPYNVLGRIAGYRPNGGYAVDFGFPYNDKLHNCNCLETNTGLWLLDCSFEKVDV